MVCYQYDGTYAGFLCCLAESIRAQKEPADIRPDHSADGDLFCRPVGIETRPARAARVVEILRRQLPRTAERHIQRAFLADVRGREMDIYRYVRRGLVLGAQLDRWLTDPAVQRVHKLSRIVGCEAHRLRGFVRFREVTEGFLYAPIAPVHQVLPLIAGSFSRRLASRDWVIHDTRRHIAAVYHHNRCTINGFRLRHDPHSPAAERQCQQWWRTYVQHIAIPQRRNPKLQRQHVPLRYRPFMVEFQTDRV